MGKVSLKTNLLSKYPDYGKLGIDYPADEAVQVVEKAKVSLIGQKVNQILAYGWNGYYDEIVPSDVKPLSRDYLDIYDWESHFIFIIGKEQFEITLFEPRYYEIGLNTKNIDEVLNTRDLPEAQVENLWADGQTKYLDISHMFEKDVIGQKVKNIGLIEAKNDAYDYLEAVEIVLENGLTLKVNMELDNPGLHIINKKY
ncbi:MAG: hypothetical protein IJ830_06010 [Alphaproteobacteria bacterium]|nr:hypothetical protein [Alphaproteobacteria bacterium]